MPIASSTCDTVREERIEYAERLCAAVPAAIDLFIGQFMRLSIQRGDARTGSADRQAGKIEAPGVRVRERGHQNSSHWCDQTRCEHCRLCCVDPRKVEDRRKA